MARSGAIVPNSIGSLPAVYRFLDDCSWHTKCYMVHSVPLNIFSNDEQLYKVTDFVLGCFAAQEPGLDKGLSLFLLHIDDADFPGLPLDPLGSAKRLLYHGPIRTSTCTLYQLGHLVWGKFVPFETMFLDLNQGAAVCVLEKQKGSRWSYKSLALVIPQLFRTRSYCFVHAGGAALDNNAVLICGGKGVGKTTISMALVRDGFDFLSDERVILHQHNGGIEVLPFPGPVNLARSSLRFFPELEKKLAGGFIGEAGKQRVCMGRCFPHEVAGACTPRLVVFPFGFHEGDHEVSHLGTMDAFGLLCKTSLDITHPRWSVMHLETLWNVVEASRTMQVRIGANVDELPGLIRSLISS